MAQAHPAAVYAEQWREAGAELRQRLIGAAWRDAEICPKLIAITARH